MPAPSQAAAVGYNTNTFSTQTFNAANVDKALTRDGSRFQWFQGNFFGNAPNMSQCVLNADGTLTINGGPEGPSLGICTATSTGAGVFAGRAFGGGAYFEAEITYNQNGTTPDANSWPSFWAMSIEHLVGMASQQWPGQASNYHHYFELDIFEYDISSSNYGGSGHDWSGVNPGSGYPVNYTISNAKPFSGGFDFTQFHKYGALWVPATGASQGYISYYLDDVRVGDTATWDASAAAARPRNQSVPDFVSANILTGNQAIFTGATGGAGTFPTNWAAYGIAGTSISLSGPISVNGTNTEFVSYRRITAAAAYEGLYTGSPGGVATAPSIGRNNAYAEYQVSAWIRRPTGVTGGDVSIDIDAYYNAGGIPATLATASQVQGQTADVWVPYTVQFPIIYNVPNIIAWKACTYIAFFNQFDTTAGVGWDLALPSVQQINFYYSTWSIIDQQHLPLILGTGTGWPMTVRSVNVWQANRFSNLVFPAELRLTGQIWT